MKKLKLSKPRFIKLNRIKGVVGLTILTACSLYLVIKVDNEVVTQGLAILGVLYILDSVLNLDKNS